MTAPSVIAPSQLLDLTGRRALVTGAGRGIGAHVARRLAEAGARVAIHFRQSKAGADAVAREIRSGGGEAWTVEADLSGPPAAVQAAAEDLVDRAATSMGGIDVVVNNAGTYPLHPFLELAAEDAAAVWTANVAATTWVTQAAARRMTVGGPDRVVVNVSSIEASAPGALHTHYVSAKAAIEGFTRAAALELGPLGIRVVAVAPGLTFYPELPGLWPDGVERYRNAAPLGRLVQPGEIADTVLFLASPAARAITGTTVVVDAGVLATPAF